MKKVAVIGATGYTGQELIRILVQHPEVKVHSAVSSSKGGKPFASVYPSFSKTADFTCSSDSIEAISTEVDLIFIALPHGLAAKMVNQDVLDKCAVVDLGADFRLKNAGDYDEWYDFTHPNPALLEFAAYGLPELNREKIKSAKLIANPGCYATCSILSLAPLLSAGLVDESTVIVDAKSGVSGAGRSLSLGVHFNECNESIKAYKLGTHRHTPEIEQALHPYSDKSLAISFTPHLVPMNRGILCTSYGSLKKKMTEKELFDLYSEFYEDEQFIRIFDPQSEEYQYPETRWVKGSNYCDIGLSIDKRTNRAIIVGALDNLVKGAAGQAVQNMNIHFGWQESTGLNHAPIFPA
ncbi:MAG: N-acetyl-gamma-glutamyl-phosphate reductase [Cyanobacteria bacterium DS2.3.42]|nr:N-acetyl-gamma-glutamyl-phosphate reductase [Cyanobacteria bacterium DS2.3.42]